MSKRLLERKRYFVIFMNRSQLLLVGWGTSRMLEILKWEYGVNEEIKLHVSGVACGNSWAFITCLGMVRAIYNRISKRIVCSGNAAAVWLGLNLG
ncbi:hypothetical protein CEXT_213881 [Caerostris extrusa]|uniref:Uncharacterized protein n=1 Tax=Caerostris extrusa TaxID=172846 RepID=A0AAV4MW80_CAEEX|nr:hypothetical protein CEXT_213881 [Caerostris extrusa]